MTDYDRPFYKQLAKNDLPIRGHQGGPAIPKALVPFFPPLEVGSGGPTAEFYVTLDLFDGEAPVGSIVSRWHFQTWGNRRTPEHRLTQNLHSTLLHSASVGDILMFERQADSVDRFRVRLVHRGTSEYRELAASNPGKRWGAVTEGNPPDSLMPLVEEIDDIIERGAEPFSLFQNRPAGSAHRRLLRSAAFSRLVKRAYEHRCAACGYGFVVPVDDPTHEPPSEPEAAHVVPVSLGGPDDLRNGLCLCRSHHWAFDQRIIYVDPQERWRVIDRSKKENRNAALNDIDGSPLLPPVGGFAAPHSEALQWHRKQTLAS